MSADLALIEDPYRGLLEAVQAIEDLPAPTRPRRRGLRHLRSKKPDYLNFEYLDALLRNHPNLVGTPAAALTETLMDWMVSA